MRPTLTTLFLLLSTLVCGTTRAADDSAWLRRAALDVTGRLPSASQAERARRAPGPATRAALADELLATPMYARRWGRLLAAPLIGGDRELTTLARRLEDFVTGALAARRGWDGIARELLTAEGSVDDTPATAFLLQFIEARTDVASRVGTGLMGVRLACAQCHDHPFAKWTVADFHGLAACFSRTRRMDVPRELYAAYRDGRRADLSQVDIVLPKGTTAASVKGQLERLGKNFAVLNRHQIGGPPRSSASKPSGRLVEMELLTASSASAARAATTADSSGSAPTMGAAAMRVTDFKSTVPVLIEEGENELSRPDLPAIPGNLSVTMNVSARYVAPRLPATGPLPKSDRPRREVLAAWLTAPDRGYIDRALVNRAHAHLFGKPIVEPVDGLDTGDDPRLTALAAECARDHHDVAGLLRRLILSPEYLAPTWARPLDAEQIAGALESGLGLSETTALSRALARQARQRADDATQEGREQLTALDLPAALTWIASPELDEALARSTLVKSTERLPADRRLEALMKTLLARTPTEEERARFAAARPADTAWALIASAEFLTQH